MTSDGDDDGDDWWWWWWRWWWWKKYNFSAWWDPSVWCQTDSWSHRHKNNKHWNGTEMRKMRKVKVVMTVKWKTTGKEQKCFCIQSLFLRCKIEKGPWSPRVKMILVNFCGEIKVKVKWQNKNRTIYSRNEERRWKILTKSFREGRECERLRDCRARWVRYQNVKMYLYFSNLYLYLKVR